VHLIASPWQEELIRDAMPCADSRLHLHSAAIGSSALARNLWYYRELPRMAADLDAEIVHLGYPSPLQRRAFACPTVVTLHDLYPYDIPENFGFPKVLVNRIILKQCLHAADAIACVSASTRSRLSQVFSSAVTRKASVINNCVEPSPKPSSEPRYTDRSIEDSLLAIREKPFLLCVAQHRRNKNIPLLLRVFYRLRTSRRISSETRLVVLGIAGPETEAIQRYVTDTGLADRVVLLSGISEADLHWCYRHCELVLAPSSVEGFGLPVAEALMAGCRVICSDIPVFREVGEDHCRYVTLDSRAEDSFSDAICAALAAPPGQPVVLPQLSRKVIAAQYLQLYQSLASHASSPQAQASPAPISISEGRSIL
jgi:glycosyltransferase involved in cell wall biosynthesis